MVRTTFRAMGTNVSCLLPVTQAAEGDACVQLLFEEWETCLSRFQPTSELARLNATAGLGARAVSPLLWRVLKRALEAARATGGLYDPSLLGQLILLGYDRSFDELPLARPPLHSQLSAGGAWRGIELSDDNQRRVTLPPGCQLDFGGIAKGMAVDAALAALQAREIRPALVNAGGDLAVLDLPPANPAWSLAIPGRDQHWTLPLRQGALATSGRARRHWQQGQETRHHLLDPRNGEPAPSGLWSVSVSAALCEQAEVATKVAFILGPQQGAAFLASHQLAGLLVRMDGSWLATDLWPTDLMPKEGPL